MQVSKLQAENKNIESALQKRNKIYVEKDIIYTKILFNINLRNMGHLNKLLFLFIFFLPLLSIASYIISLILEGAKLTDTLFFFFAFF